MPQARGLARRIGKTGQLLTYVDEAGLRHAYPLLPVPGARRVPHRVRALL
jgi:hypothetical protein